MAATATTTQTQPPNALMKAPKGPKGLPRSKLVCFSFAAYSKALINHLKTLDSGLIKGQRRGWGYRGQHRERS
ncbi:hypothetical protein CCACVL1_03889 [Corchorus capsularis]|uniref:Uncharacterized protein n=1 Tax=Corchorus capsularis TaxID=210143 RepID=A0A1R3JWH2_COCAP|nr:hypothetical protein CCACVL1_03889 [Corchorus capsularis]